MLVIWEISESINELKQLGNTISLKGYNSFHSENRIKQWFATRLLINHIFEGEEIQYNEFGKPYLNNGWHISISHTSEYAVILLNQNNSCGIDIEKISPKVERIKHKFLSTNDLKKVSTEKELTIYWCAKEALYKYYGKKEVLFIENLFIEEFNPNTNEFKGIIKMQDFETELKMRWEQIEDSVLVYTL